MSQTTFFSTIWEQYPFDCIIELNKIASKYNRLGIFFHIDEWHLFSNEQWMNHILKNKSQVFIVYNFANECHFIDLHFLFKRKWRNLKTCTTFHTKQSMSLELQKLSVCLNTGHSIASKLGKINCIWLLKKNIVRCLMSNNQARWCEWK